MESDLLMKKKWAPRTGYGKPYEEWNEDLSLLLKALGMTREDLSTPCPQLDAIPHTPTYTPYGAVEEQKELKAKWQSVSTTLYFHVFPSLVTQGLYAKVDRDYINSL